MYSNYAPKQAYYAYANFIDNPYAKEGPDYSCISSEALDDDPEKMDVLRGIRDNLMAVSRNGLRNIYLYYRHSPQINRIISTHPGTKAMVGGCIEIFLPGQGETFTADDAATIAVTCRELRKHADEDLAKVLRGVEVEIGGYAGLTKKGTIRSFRMPE